jgi:hypothetical protein
MTAISRAREWLNSPRLTPDTLAGKVVIVQRSHSHNDNVRRALQQLRVTCPIVIDNDYAIWRAFDNHYWPGVGWQLGPPTAAAYPRYRWVSARRCGRPTHYR